MGKRLKSATSPAVGENVATPIVEGERLSKRNLWFYSTGGIGRDMSYNLWNGFILSFILFTKSLDTSQIWAVTLIMVLCRVWDGINDPIMGGIVENTKSKFGKFKPWLLIGAITNSVIVILMFSVPLTGWAFIGFFTAMYLLWDITYTMNDIGYWAMMPSLTSNPQDRNTLASLAGLCSGLGSILTSVIVPEFTTSSDASAVGGGAVKGYAIVAVLIAACFVGCQLITFFMVKEKPLAVAEKKPSIGFKKMVSIIIKNDQLLWMALVLLLFNIGNSVISSTLGYNYIYFVYGYEGGYASTFATVFAAFSAVIMIIYPFISKKFSRKSLMRLAIISTILGYTLMLLTCSFVKVPFAVLCIFGGLIGFGQNFLNMIILINLTNTIEYNEWKTNSRDEGIIFSVRPFMAKISSALLLLITTAVFSITGALDISDAISDIEQEFSMGHITDEQKLSQIGDVIGNISSNTTLSLLIFISLLAMILLFGAYFIMAKKCVISEERYNEMLADIAQRKKDEEEQGNADNIDGELAVSEAEDSAEAQTEEIAEEQKDDTETA